MNVCPADDLAVHLDMSRGHLSDFERGKREAGTAASAVFGSADNRLPKVA
jgi:predicted transcriptional regulator